MLILGSTVLLAIATAAPGDEGLGGNQPRSAGERTASADAFAFLNPCNMTVAPGSTFTVDLMINGGTNTISGQQSYLTFSNALLKVISQNGDCSSSPATTVQPDPSTLDVVLQNQVDNNSGEIAYASSTFGAGATGSFRVARITFCALGSGVATLHWQFSPPAPSNRNSAIVDNQSQKVTNPNLYQDCTINLSAAKITSIGRSGSGTVHLAGTGAPNAEHTLQFSSSDPGAASFAFLVHVTPNGSGIWSYDDTSAVGQTKRFYRLTFP